MSEVQPGPEPLGKPDASCSFCRKSYLHAGPLVEGPDIGKGSVYICRECAAAVVSLIDTEKRRRENKSAQAADSWTLDVEIAAAPERVWQALVSESAAWWPQDFHTSDRARRFVIEPVLGGRAYEDFGEGDGLVWYRVVGLEVGRELLLAGHLLPPFGGPAVTALRLTLSASAGGTLLHLRDDRFGSLGGESPLEGWRLVFEAGLRRHLESGGRPA